MKNEIVKTENMPKVIVFHHEKKLRDYSLEQRLTISTAIVTDLLALLGVSGKSDVEHHVRSIRFVRDALLNYSQNQIIEAFEKFVAGDFELEAFQQLNAVVIGRVMSRYEKYRREELHKWKLKNKPKEKMDDVEFNMIEACDRLFKDWKTHNRITEISVHVYNHFYNKGLLPKHDKKFRDEIKERAIPRCKAEAMKNVQLGKIKRGQMKEIMHRVENMDKGLISTMAKRIILEDFFQKLKDENKNINDVC